ncbi:MAG: aminopeptidase P family protein [bacterium]|nr:aminopeptidase P family protein [bacterium]
MVPYPARIAALRAATGLEDGAVDAVILVPGTNLIYFLGLEFHLSERPTLAIIQRESMSMIVPYLEMPKLHNRPDLEIRPFAWRDETGFIGAFQEAVDALGLRGARIAIDGMTMRASEWLALQEIDPALRPVRTERALIGLRARKTADEIASLRNAVQISENALDHLLREVKPGMTEAQIAARLESLMMDLGAHGKSFDTLVQSGVNSSNPHGSTTDRAVQAGEFLLIDWGAKVDGYLADLTRTFCIGEPSAEMQRIYDTVLAANEAAKAAVRPGVPMSAIDHAARSVIDAAGYGVYFTHRTGHGLGMDGHEPIPQIAANVTDLLEPGMVFTIEPGIYLPELGGVRIEDDVLVTETGADILSTYPRTLRLP